MLKNLKVSQVICFGGIFTALAIVFQSAPVFLPTIGMALSPLTTLPIILATVIEVPIGMMVLISSVLIMFVINPQEAAIMLLTTGPLGISIGLLLFKRRIIISVSMSAITLFIGILLLTYVVGIQSFGSISKTFSITLILFYLIFSFGYSFFWVVCAKKIVRRLIKAKLFQAFINTKNSI